MTREAGDELLADDAGGAQHADVEGAHVDYLTGDLRA